LNFDELTNGQAVLVR